MRSRAEWRRGAEWLLRAAALGLLGWCLYASAAGRRATNGTTLATGMDTTHASAGAQLASWTRDAGLERLHVSLAAAPDAVTRDWLHALDAAGTEVTWAGDVPALAIAAEAAADPRGSVRLSVAAPAGVTVHVADGVGRIDSVVAAAGGGSVRAASVVGAVTARADATNARVTPTSERTLRSVVLLGRAGWEAKFTAAALEERGWRVTVRMQVAPGLTVGSAPPLDTARVSAVIALDSTAASEAPAIARYVRAGGGLVLGAEAARLPAFGALTAGRAGATVRAAASYAAAVAPVTQQTLAIAPLRALRPDAVVLERRDAEVVLAARRVDAGRVVQLGYDETWRWRLAGGDDSPEAHRRWWSELVGSVAYAPAADVAAPAVTNEPAPRAALVAALGEAGVAPTGASASPPFDPSRSLLVYIAVALLLCTEWASRRLRGAK
ncbi:MAG TPA: hypothetical protein VFT96_02385 [Gemmatimonadaceae bacterium]|nr:hypothetical protein [Gemmatimonadaceae bacterium]